MRGADQSQRAVWTGGRVGKLRRAVAANSITADSFHAEVDLLMEQRPLSTGTNTAAGGVHVGRTKAANRGWLRGTAGEARRNQRRIRVARIGAYHAARVDAVAEEAHDAEQFVVTKAGVGCGLEDQIRSLVCGIAVGVESIV